MGYKCLFVDNEEYSASDVNDVLKSFVTGGIEDPFTDGEAYHIGKLNDITVALSDAGIVPDDNTSCKCSINTEEKRVFIFCGTLFFNNGARIVINTEGVTLNYTAGETNYVYAIFSQSENNGSLICTTELPAEGDDYVMLAEISAEEILTDKRKYARGKLPGYQSNAGLPMYINDTVVLKRVEENTYKGTYTIYLGENHNYSVIIANNTSAKAYSSAWGICDLRENLSKNLYYYSGDLHEEIKEGLKLMFYRLNSNSVSADIDYTGTEIILNLSAIDYADGNTTEFQLELTIY